ncbi:MAG: hypothetical protein KF863_22705 [Rubrivivax sp.]|nr:hypothetical protein [Rubrivivax sp.]
MITRPEDVLATGESGGWDGRSIDPKTNVEHDNKETAMDWAEHQRIVCDARKLLAGEIEISPSDVKKAFRELRSAYNDASSRSVVKVSKGIHQPTVNPHLQLRMVTTFGKGADAQEVVRKFHLDVSAVDTPEMEGRFRWTGVQFSYVHSNDQVYKWPVAATPVIVKRQRRLSVSSVDLSAHLQKQEQERQQEAARLEAEAEDRKLRGWLEQYGIAASNLNKLKRGQSVPGRDGAYQYGKVAAGKLAFQRTGTKGYQLV